MKRACVRACGQGGAERAFVRNAQSRTHTHMWQLVTEHVVPAIRIRKITIYSW